MILFFDTETTGLVNSKLPLTHSAQPRMVQLGMIVTDDKGHEEFTLNTLIRPNGFCIPDDMIHGISDTRAKFFGLGIEEVLNVFNAWLERTNLLVCHNFGFDSQILNIELKRYLGEIADVTKKPSFCTMKEMTDICCIPHTRFKNSNKWPTLNEAYSFLFKGRNIANAHSAIDDCRATKEIFFKMKELNLVKQIYNETQNEQIPQSIS